MNRVQENRQDLMKSMKQSQYSTRFCLSGLLFCVLAAISLSASAEAPPQTGSGQLGAPITWIDVPGKADHFYMAQETDDGKLFLTPNESFFPKMGLVATGQNDWPDVNELNKGNSFSRIEKWDSGDTAEWGIFLEKPGELTVRIMMTSAGATGRYSLVLGESRASFSTKQSPSVPKQTIEKTFHLKQRGRHSLQLVCEKPGTKTALHWIEISGPAADGSSVLRKRWRPAAAHTRFSSSQTKGKIRLWVMELDAVPGELKFYCPVTTPFGYYGPTWNADGTVNSSFNFSLWSFGRGKPEPPVEQLSHLLAVGKPDATFGGFDHEGTGVKIRNWEPLQGRQGQRQVLALRVEPGKTYDTYFSYFYASDEKRWRLFGVGNKFNKQKPLSSLWVGSFVEVPGPAHVQRTGPYKRTMRYRGWVMDANENWSQLDSMKMGDIDRKTGLTYTDRGVTKDGWFYLQTGGWEFRKESSKNDVRLNSATPVKNVPFLTPSDIQSLKTVPAEIVPGSINRRGSELHGEYEIRGLAKNPEVTLYWGTSEGLTLEERWEHKQTLPTPQVGKNRFILKGLPTSVPIYCRFLLKNSEGKFWSTETKQIRND